jgi:cytoskeletal protein CcmA (bactofilin family)
VDATEVKSASLLVTGTTDLNGDVYVDGSINVRGSVIGSGPYIDTSDSRFKTNITQIKNALEIVKKMNGV